MEIEVAILTKSSKNNGYCVAGIDIHNGQWVRLTSNDKKTHGALVDEHMRYRDNTCCEILDVVKIPIIKKNPTEHQPENVLIHDEQYWEKLNTWSIKDVLRVHPAERHFLLLGNQYPYITEAKIGTLKYSLVLIMVNNLIITRPQKTKATFRYGLNKYENMSVTDPDYYNVSDPTKIDEALLVVSLPDTPYPETRYYKFIAKIFPV